MADPILGEEMDMTVVELRKKLEQFGAGREVKIVSDERNDDGDHCEYLRNITSIELFGENVLVNHD
jgi:hypothetical protein